MANLLLNIIKQAEQDKKAVGHFNVANFEMVKAVTESAEDKKTAVIIGTSEGERSYLGVNHIRALIDSYNQERKSSLGGKDFLFLNADHTYDLEKIRIAAEAGYDMVIFDGAALPLEENVAKTKKAVEIAKSINPDILVEGELGYIGQSSKLLDKAPEGAAIDSASMPTGEQALEFVKATGIDLLAPAVGNIHGMFKNAPNPNLNISRISEIKEAVGIPLVLHGGSGIRDDDFKKAIQAGISVVHISTEMRLAWRKSLAEKLSGNPEELAPYRIGQPVVSAVKQVVTNRLSVFGW